MHHRNIAAMLVGTSLLASCAPSLPGLRPLTYATPGEARLYVSGGRCLHGPAGNEAAGLVAAALLEAGSQALKNFGQALKDGSQGGALQPVVATQNIQLLPDTSPKCVTLVRGSFDDKGNAKGSRTVASYVDIGEDDKDFTSLNIPKVTALDYYIELQLANSTNHKALKFNPVYALVERSIDGDTKGTRDVSIALKFSKIGASDVGSTVVLGNQTIGAGKKFEPQAAGGRYIYEAPWFGAFNAKANDPASPTQTRDLNPPTPPTGTPPVGTGGGAISSGGNNGQNPSTPVVDIAAKGNDAVPITVSMTVVETRPTKEGLAFIASIFNGIEPQIETAAKPLIDSKAASAQESSDLSALSTFSTAQGTAQGAMFTYCSASSTDDTLAGKQDRITKSSAARSAQIQANVAAIAASQPKPFLKLVNISTGLARTANNDACTQF